jgi:putative FmdB family regulatory protein
MPLYEYECTQCGDIEEAIQKFSDAPLTTCKLCSGKLNKLISQTSFHLKGTGWYVTDYSKKSGPKTNDSNATPTAPADKQSSKDGTSSKATSSDD